MASRIEKTQHKLQGEAGGEDEGSYAKRVDDQVRQFANMERLKGLPPIYRYWTKKYVTPKIRDVFGVETHLHLYISAFGEALKHAEGAGKILSIGSGDAKLEVALAEQMLAAGIRNFTILATELSEVRLERARRLVHENQLDDYFEFEVVDVNEWHPEERFHGVMAQHTLHHIVELEKLFSFIDRHMYDEGAFVVVDMIGRNGHMRWPETLEYVEKIWSFLPDRYKYNHQFGQFMPEYVNWDCSNKGFEGIRAQDILPLLCEYFRFTHFLAVGGIVEVFVDRGFGHNFDVENPADTNFIDIVAQLNDALLETGVIKPTIIFAVCRKKGVDAPVHVFHGMHPADMVRVPDK
jgi:SAM-dependent methyltransferase